MTKHEELIEKVARVLCREVMGIEYDAMSESASYLERKSNTEAAILDKQEAREISSLIVSTILTALKEPTDEMVIAAGKAWGITVTSNEYENMEDEWRLMLAASPLAPEGGGT